MSPADDARTDGEAAVDNAEEDPDQRALRRSRWLLVTGTAIGALGALVTGVLGASGRTGLVLTLIGTAFGAALSAVWLFGSALSDEFRGRPVGRRRPLWGLAGFAGAGMILLMLLGMTP